MLSPEATAAVAPPKIGFHLLSSEVVDLTPDVLAKFRDLPASSMERELNRSRVKHLREKADAGMLVTFHWVTGQRDDKIVRINGQHSSTMLAEMDGQFPYGLKVHREHYRLDDDEAGAVLFQQFDDRRSGRSSVDVAAVYQGLHPELNGIDHAIAKLAIDGYCWFQRNITNNKPTAVGDMVYGLFGDVGLHPFIRWLAEVHSSKTNELKNRTVAAAMFGTFSANETAARQFWDLVSRAGDPDQENLPETQLDRWLLSIYDGTFEPSGKFGAANIFQGCVYAWNASREGKTFSTIRYDVKKNITAIKE